jgi:hypothetical protein
MTSIAETLEKKAKRYLHFLLLMIGADVFMNFVYVSMVTVNPLNTDFTPVYVILEFIFLAGVLYCLSTRNQCLKELKEENVKNQLS